LYPPTWNQHPRTIMTRRATAAVIAILLLSAPISAGPPATSTGGPESRGEGVKGNKELLKGLKGPLAERPRWVVNISYIDRWLEGRRWQSKAAQATIILMGDEAIASYSWDGKTYVDSLTWAYPVMVGKEGCWVYLCSDKSFGLAIATSGRVYYTFDSGGSCALWPGRLTKNKIDLLTRTKPARPEPVKKPEPGKIDDIDDTTTPPSRPKKGADASGDKEPEAVKKYREKYKPAPRP
jgi:hypothetical protein